MYGAQMASALDQTAVRTSRASTPESIDTDLAALWRELASSGAALARAVMSNLIVFRDRLETEYADLDTMTADLPLDGVVARHPSRVIVIEHERGRAEPAAPFAAAVGIVAFGPPQARYGVEQIVVRSACAEASLPSIVRRFIRGDLPTSIWWTEDLADRPPLEAFVALSRQLIYDSRDWRDVRAAIRALAPLVAEHRIDLADVNWRRLAPLRRALGYAAGTDAPAAAFAGAQVRVVHRAEDAALAWLLAGWLLAARETNARPAPPPEITASATGDTVLAITIRQGHRETTATLTTRSIVVADSESTAAPLVVGIPVEADAEAIAAELRTLSHDIALHDAIAALVRHFEIG
jgi:glucose-6-phosphate dehydrogenase assembly protein OpcA